MAGDWLQIDLDLPEKWEVQAVTDASRLCHADVTLGRLLLFWRWVERHASSELVRGATIQTLIRVAGGDEEFWRAVESVGWVAFSGEGIVIPGWKKRFDKSAKSRILAARRQKKRRASVTVKRDKSNGSALPKEEKNRIEDTKGVNPLKPPAQTFPEELNTGDFRIAWADWCRHRAEIKKPLKPTQVTAQLDMLASKGHDAALAMIRHTIAMGWQGLKDPEPQSVRAGPSASERPMLDPSIFGD